MVEEFASAAGADASYFSNAVSEFVLAEKAEVTHAVAQQQATSSVHLQTTFVRQVGVLCEKIF